MNLVNELQSSAVSDDVLVVLRNAMRLSSKLGRDDITEWLEFELNGYQRNSDLPEYRMIGAMIGFKSTGTVSPGFGFSLGEISLLPMVPVRTIRFPIIEPISTIAPLICELSLNTELCVYSSAEDGSVAREAIKPLIAEMDCEMLEKIRLLVILNHCEIKAIPERIKDKILKWALALESAGVNGSGISFSAKEKVRSEKVIFNIRDSEIGQLSATGRNQHD